MAERYSVRVEGAKYDVSFGSALAIAISYHRQPLDSVGDHPRDLELAIRNLFCAVPRLTN